MVHCECIRRWLAACQIDVARLLWALTIAFGAIAAPSAATAGTVHVEWGAPTGTSGWCTAVFGTSGDSYCYASPYEACARQWQEFGPSATFYGYAEYSQWNSKACKWVYNWPDFGPLPATVYWACSPSPPGILGIAPGRCLATAEDVPTRVPGDGGIGMCRVCTPHPIDIVTGNKFFRAEDFQAEGATRLSRSYSSLPLGGAKNAVSRLPAGLANWTFDFAYELQVSSDWDVYQIVAVNSPSGAAYRFHRNATSGLMEPAVSTEQPMPQQDYFLTFDGTWPGTLSTLANAVSKWILQDSSDRIWYLETRPDPISGKFIVARPMRMVEPGGREYTFTYSNFFELLAVADNQGNEVAFDWIRTTVPVAIGAAHLPDGKSITYVYGTIAATGSNPDRLARVEYRDAAGTVVDKTSYDYGDARFPYAITAVKDRNDAVRWSVTYDVQGRALTSSGPSDVDKYAVAYGAMSSTFTRTVTNPFGKVSTYTFTRSGSSYYGIKLTGIATAATANTPASTVSVTNGTDYFQSGATDEEGRIAASTRDTRGRAIQVVEAQGTPQARATSTTWRSDLNLPTQIVAPGLTTTFTYAAGTSGGAPPAPTVSQAYAYSGSAQTYTVPAGISSATIELWGGAGGNGNYTTGAWSGAGGYVKATFAVSPGDVLKFEVGGGGAGAMRNANGGAGGWPDGGSGAHGDAGDGGGGGSSRFYINSILKAVAGGGGGSGGWSTPGVAGAGGGANGQSATGAGGTGGSATAGGVDISQATDVNKMGRSIVSFPGAQRLGGWGSTVGNNTTATSDDGGGGGGGYWGGGGGGGDSQSGGGGSSWIDASATKSVNLAGNRQTPAMTPAGQPTVAIGVNSGSAGAAVAGGDGYALLKAR